MLLSGWSEFFWFTSSPVSFQAFGDRSQRTNYNRYHHHFHVLKYLSIFSIFFPFNSMVHWNGKIHQMANSFLLVNHLVGIEWPIFISKSQRILWVSSLRTNSGSCISSLFLCSNFNLLQNFLCISFPVLFQIIYFFCGSLLHSCIIVHSLLTNRLISVTT